MQNREHIRLIVDTILTSSRQNVGLRGNRGELGSISADGKEPIENAENFRPLLRYRIRGGDSVLQEHSSNAKANAAYQSAAIQNELITTAANLTRDKVVARIKEARFWTIIADETMIVKSDSNVQLSYATLAAVRQSPGIYTKIPFQY